MIRKKIWMPGDALPTYATHLINGTQVSTLSVVNGSLQLSATMTFTGGNIYIYKDMQSITDYTIQSGDFIEYDVYWDNDDAKILFDFTCTNATTLRDSNIQDQNGLSVHTGTNISSRAYQKWYRRKINLATYVGRTINFFDIACEKDTSGTYVARLTNIAITDGYGAMGIPIPKFKYN